MTFRELRERKFEKLTDFAIALKENISTVSMWESGKSAPKTKNIAKISKVLQVPIAEVVACFTEKKEEG